MESTSTCGRLAALLLAALFVGAPLLARAEEPLKATALGEKVPEGGSLRDLHGNRRSVHSFTGYKALVLAFLGTDCPISNAYVPRLLELERKFRARKVQFLAVYANEHEDLDQVASHAYDRNLPFPVLKDFGQRVADSLGVDRLSTVVVLDGEFNLRYRGRIDDQVGVSARRAKATRADLAEAIGEVLAGKKVSVAETEPDGCLIDRVVKVSGKAVTYTRDVAPILQRRCQTCHRPDQTAPFALLTYEDAVKHGRMIREVTTQHRMPPWHADSRYGTFTNDRRMTASEIETLAAWVDADMPRGDDKDLPAPIDWPKGWNQGQPDMVVSMPEEFEVPALGQIPYKYYEVNPGFTEDRWVQRAEALPGSVGVVHHIVVYVLRPGEKHPFQSGGALATLVGWAPGDLGLVCPPDTAMRVPKGARLLFEMHYTTNGQVVKDRSQIGITFAKKAPRYELFMNEFANETIRIPPNEPHYQAETTLQLPSGARVISFVPHMHWRGKDFRYEVLYPNGKRETVLSVPRWDFSWQSVYRFKEPLKLPEGAKLHAIAHWDNSRNNPLNPAPDKSVHFGLQTSDEMMVGWVAFVMDRTHK